MEPGERFNSISHLVGILLALVGTTALLTVSAMQHDALKIFSFLIYGLMLILLYTMSTLYHTLRGRPKQIFRKLDHLSVYLLIAGTYTPITLIALRHHSSGWTLFAAVWTLALIGVAYEFLAHQGRRMVPGLLGLAMGWLVVFAFRPLLLAISPAGIAWLLAGGVFYSIGTIFFALSRKHQWGHAVWHVFVILGSVAHFVAVYEYIALR